MKKYKLDSDDIENLNHIASTYKGYVISLISISIMTVIVSITMINFSLNISSFNYFKNNRTALLLLIIFVIVYDSAFLFLVIFMAIKSYKYKRKLVDKFQRD